MHEELVASWVCNDGVPYVTAEGELTAATAPLLDEALFEARSYDPFSIVLRLENCMFCDSKGLGVILRHAKPTPQFVIVSPPNSVVRRFLRITRADERFEVVDSVDAVELRLPTEHVADGVDHALKVR
jgi:anti-anti-sigma factor